MTWNYLHFEHLPKSELGPAPLADDESALQAFLNRYGSTGWELVYCERKNGSYELILKSERRLLGG
jgi:hypothetical protein